MRMNRLTFTVILSSTLALTACGEDIFEDSGLGGELTFDNDRPDFGDGMNAEPYTGDNVYVQEAQALHGTGLDLHRNVIVRTCSPTGGVCHNQAEYPDLHTPANLLSNVGAPCNVQPGEATAVFNRCEQPGDRFRLTGIDMPEVEIGFIEYIPGEAEGYSDENLPTRESPGFHVELYADVPTDRQNVYSGGSFIRTFINEQGNVQDLPYATFDTRWWIIEGNHLVGEVRNYQNDTVTELETVGIRQGDFNRDGVYGARDSSGTVPMIAAGDPESSYLIARIRGEMHGEDVPGSRMPLANPPLTIPDMLGLYCFIEGLPGFANMNDAMSAPIDYANCSYSADPESLNLLGDGVTWVSRIQPVLEANCGGCHSDTRAEADFIVTGDDAYIRLLSASVQNPDMNLIEPGDPANSYLFLKLIGDESIVGLPMPINPITGVGRLSESELNDIQAWIENGAVENQ